MTEERKITIYPADDYSGTQGSTGTNSSPGSDLKESQELSMLKFNIGPDARLRIRKAFELSSDSESDISTDDEEEEQAESPAIDDSEIKSIKILNIEQISSEIIEENISIEAQKDSTATPSEDKVALLVDMIIPPAKRTEATASYVAKINTISGASVEAIRKTLTNIFNKDNFKDQISKAEPKELEKFANGVMRTFAEIQLDKSHSKGAKFILNNGTSIELFEDFFLSLWAVIRSGSIEPLQNWYHRQSHAIVWDVNEFDKFLTAVTDGTVKTLEPKQAEEAMQKLEAVFAPSIQKQ